MRFVDNVGFPDSNADLLVGFIEAKRASGYAYAGAVVYVVRRLALFLESRGDGGVLTEEAAVEWTRRRDGESAGTQAIRANVARQYGLYLRSLGIEGYVLPSKMKPREKTGFEPFIFSEEQIRAVAGVLDGEPPSLAWPNAHVVYPLLFRMLYGCGLRISEALSLRGRDVDTAAGTLDVVDGKSGSRRVPMSASLTRRCAEYVGSMGPSVTGGNYFFPGMEGKGGGHLGRRSARVHLQGAFAAAGVLTAEGKPPRVHDLRHTFVCHAIEKASAEGMDPNAALPALSVMVGHRSIGMTQRYIHLTDSARAKVVGKMAGSSGLVLQEAES